MRRGAAGVAVDVECTMRADNGVADHRQPAPVAQIQVGQGQAGVNVAVAIRANIGCRAECFAFWTGLPKFLAVLASVKFEAEWAKP